MSYVADFFHSFDKVLCLSLIFSENRRAHIRSLLATHEIENVSFFDAVPASDPLVNEHYQKGLVKSFPDCFRCGKLECGRDDCNNTLIPAQVATFLSYLKLWRYISRKKLGAVLIIEDDIKLTATAEHTCKSIINNDFLHQSELFTNEPRLLRFGWGFCEDHQSQQAFSFASTIKMANPAHAINSEMAKFLIRKFKSIDTTVDIYQHRNCATEQNSSTAYPPIFYEMSWSTGEVDSLIHPKNVRLKYLEKENMSESAEYHEAKQGIQRHRQHTLHRKILAAGHPRCGSSYSSALLKAYGLDVSHEFMGVDGISSWMFAVYDDENPYALNKLASTRYFTHFDVQVQPVRDPRTAIPSIVTENKYSTESFEFRRQHIKIAFGVDISDFDREIEKAVASLVYWAKIIAKQKPDLVFRIEDQAEDLFAFCQQQGLSNRLWDSIELPKKTINRGKPYKGTVHVNPTYSKIEYSRISGELFDQLNDYCELYGYKLFDAALNGLAPMQ